MCTPTADKQSVARLDASMAVSRTDCGLWCGRNCHSAYVGATQETDASRNGLNYASATGDPREQKLPLLTQEGNLRAMTFQAAPVDRALGSVKRKCSSGHMAVFVDDGSDVLNKMTGEVNWVREESGNYIMDLWVMPNKGQGFTRQR